VVCSCRLTSLSNQFSARLPLTFSYYIIFNELYPAPRFLLPLIFWDCKDNHYLYSLQIYFSIFLLNFSPQPLCSCLLSVKAGAKVVTYFYAKVVTYFYYPNLFDSFLLGFFDLIFTLFVI